MTAIRLQPCGERRPVASRRGAIDPFGETARRILFGMRLWRERVRGRNELARLDLRSLADIGLTPSERDFLVNKPFWRE